MPIRARHSRPPSLGSVPSTETSPLSLEDLDRGGLARTVRAQQREHLSVEDIEVHAVDRDRLAVRLAQPSDAHARGGVHAASFRRGGGATQRLAGRICRPPFGGRNQASRTPRIASGRASITSPAPIGASPPGTGSPPPAA